MTTKKITLATVKSFIKKNSNNLFIKCETDFDGMTDCIQINNNAKFEKVNVDSTLRKNTLGINGAWFVGSSRDYFNLYELGELICINVSNCCGSFTIATTK